MIARFRRVSLHPFCWWVIVRRALQAYAENGTRDLESRRRLAAASRALEAGLDPDDPRMAQVENPYARLQKHEVRERERNNEAILLEDPDYGYWRKAEVVGGRVVPGYLPVPKPHLRHSVDLSEEHLRILERAVEAYAKNTDLDNSLSACFVDTEDALKNAEVVEVDTERSSAKAKENKEQAPHDDAVA